MARQLFAIFDCRGRVFCQFGACGSQYRNARRRQNYQPFIFDHNRTI